MFYPILSHGWVLSNHKMSARRNKVILHKSVYYCIGHTRNDNMFRPKHSGLQTDQSFIQHWELTDYVQRLVVNPL
jgi:hypothetical protein